jgi:AcrR family transcriptional regulator
MDATFEALASVGYEGLVVEDIAAAAEVALTTLYRRWPSKEELVVQCIKDRAIRENPAPTGDWRRDIPQAVRSVNRILKAKEGRAVISVMAAAHNNPNLGKPFSREYIGPIATITEAIASGVEEGELRAGLSLELILDLLVSAQVYQILALGRNLDDDVAESITDIILNGIRVREERDDYHQPKMNSGDT